MTNDSSLPQQIGPFLIRGVLAEAEEEQVLLGEDVALKRSVWLWLRSSPEAPEEAVRRDVRRPTRLRWLAGGRHAERCWDAFLAPSGCPLADCLSDKGPLPWHQVRPLLEQLAEELAEAGRDGTLPAILTADQVWTQPDGRLQLLDLPLNASAPASLPGATAGPDGSLMLLRQVAVLALEGRLRPPDTPPASIRAPLARHASRLLDRLLGVARPLAKKEEVQTELAATRHLPAELRPDRRAAHLAVLGALLSPGLFWMFWFSYLYSFLCMQLLTTDILQTDALMHILKQKALPREFEPLNKDNESRLRSRLETNKRNWRVRRFFWKYTVGLLPERDPEAAEVELILQDRPVEVQRLPGERFAVEVTRHGPGDRRTVYEEGDLTAALESTTGLQGSLGPWERIIGPPLVLFFPLAWVIWAFLFRGGWSLRLMGIALVRSNGRPALRIQCAWRAFLVWAPVTALLVLTTWLDYHSWSGGIGEEPDRGTAWLALASWWLALGLLAAYFFLAFRRPTRALHDRLAGVYLVPR